MNSTRVPLETDSKEEPELYTDVAGAFVPDLNVIECVAPPFEVPGATSVSLSFNGGVEFVTTSKGDAAHFIYFERAELTGISPPCGPKTAATDLTLHVSHTVDSAAIKVRYMYTVRSGTTPGQDSFTEVSGM